MSSREPQGKEVWVEKQLSLKQIALRAATSIGGPRSRYTDNQDVVLVCVDEKRLRAVVVDGAGSTTTGRLAATVCAETAQDLSLSLEQSYLQADKQICLQTRTDKIFDPKTSGYGAVVGCDVDLQTGVTQIVYWGDCRAVLLRENAVMSEGTTVPQNVLHDRMLAGELTAEAYYASEEPSYLSGGLGFSDLPGIRPPVVQSFIPQMGDVLVLGSDGVWDQLSDYELLQLWLQSGKDLNAFDQAVRALVFERNNATRPFELAIEAGRSTYFCPDAADNVSLVILQWT